MRDSAARLSYALAALAVVGALGPWATEHGSAVGAGTPLVALIAVGSAAIAWSARVRSGAGLRIAAVAVFAVALVGIRYAPGAAEDAAGVPGSASVSWGGLVVVACAALSYAAAALAPPAPRPPGAGARGSAEAP